MAALTSAGRKRLQDSSFAIVEGSGDDKTRRFPIDTIGRARNALARVSQTGTPEEKRKVARAVRRKWPALARRSEFVKRVLS